MNFYKTTNPKDYSLHFYKEIGLSCSSHSDFEQIWNNPQIGSIHICGSLDNIQCGTGDYQIPTDIMSEFDYTSSFLHFGIIYEGITYSIVHKKLEPLSHPSAFLSLEQSEGGIICWKRGQHFRGIEVSINVDYLNNHLLPFLGYSKDALDFINPNVRYSHISDELKDILSRIEFLINHNRMTLALQKALCLEFIAYLADKKITCISDIPSNTSDRYVHLGSRKIKLTDADVNKIILAHEQIKKEPGSFVTIYELSQALDISEQKLKVGFTKLYQQTIWNYANNLRMNQAVKLLQNTTLSISDISSTIGYQSSSAFTRMFKNWCGLTPGQFRTQTISDE